MTHHSSVSPLSPLSLSLPLFYRWILRRRNLDSSHTGLFFFFSFLAPSASLENRRGRVMACMGPPPPPFVRKRSQMMALINDISTDAFSLSLSTREKSVLHCPEEIFLLLLLWGKASTHARPPAAAHKQG